MADAANPTPAPSDRPSAANPIANPIANGVASGVAQGTDTHESPERGRRRRRVRRLRRVAILLLGLLLVAGFVLTRPAVLRWFLEPMLANALGGEVTIDDVRLSGLSTLHLGHLTLRARGWDGPAGEVLLVEDLTVQFDGGSLVVGAVRARSLQVGRMRVRIAERDDLPGTFNLLALQSSTRGDPEQIRPVRIDLGRLDVETGTASRDGTWTQRGGRSLTGFMTPDPDRHDGSLFAFQLSDVDPNGSAITGTWDERTLGLTASLDAIGLDEEILNLLPSHMRHSAEALNLTGQVRGAQMHWSPVEPLFAEFQVADMRVTLPELDLEDKWSRFRSGRREQREGLPTMHVREGAVRLEGTHVTFRRLVGEIASNTEDPGLVPVPIELGLDITLDDDTIGSIDWSDADARERWLAETFDAAPFTLSISIRGFDSAKATPGYPPALEVPTPIAAALETFGVTAWKLDVEAEFSRGTATRAADGSVVPDRIRSKGQCFLSGGEGSYDAFPYPMSQVKAHLAFDQNESGVDRLVVDYLAGTTQVGSTISITGTVTDPGPDAAVDLSITAPSFVLDEQLIRCFERGDQKSVAMLFHEPSFRALDAAGLLPTGDVTALREKAKALEASAMAIADKAELERLALERARVERMISVRPFALGGTGAIRAKIAREAGSDRPISVTGVVTIERAGILIDDFPYPLTVTSGVMNITEREVNFGEEGLRATTMEGGLVRIGGHVTIVPRAGGGTRGSPDLVITGVRDEITPLLLAAIPPPKKEPVAGWPGAALAPTARLLEAAGLRGTVDLHGTITERADVPGEVETKLRIEVSSGSVDSKDAPDVPLALPAGLSLRELEASLLVTDNRVEFRSLRAADASGVGTVIASGSYSTSDAKESLDIRFDGMQVAPWIVEALPDAAREPGRRWWERWKPRGTFDAHLTLSSDERGSAMTTIEARPRELTVAPFGTDVSVRGIDGSVQIVADVTGMRGDISALRLADGLEPDAGAIVIDGSLETTTTALRSIDLDVRAENARFEAPGVNLTLRLADATVLADGLAGTQPSGRFDGSLGFRSIAGGRPDWNLTLRPRSLAIDIGGARPAMTFDRESAVVATPSQVLFERIAADLDDGHVTFDGSIDLTQTPHVATGTMSLDASAWSDRIAALLPPPLNLARDRIGFHADSFHMHDTQLSLHWDPALGVRSPSLYAINGHISTEGGAMSIGVPLTEVTGEVDYSFRYEPREGPAAIKLGALLRSPAFRIYDRLLNDGSASLSIAPDGTTLRLRDIQGTIADGRIDGSADVRLAEGRYAADVRVTGASLAPLLAPRDPASASGGEVDARLAIEGPIDTVEGRTGRGKIAIRDAAMAKSAITLRLVEISQLMLPLSSSLKSADIQFFLRGAEATFEKFRLTTSGVTLDGTGTLDTRDFSVDLTLRSRGRLGIFSDIVGAVSDQLYEIEVKGPLTDPTAGLRALPGLRSKE